MPFDNFMTPPNLVEDIRSVLGTIDVDPASCSVAQKYIKSRYYYVHPDDACEGALVDGLHPNHHWRGNIFLNPPYSKGNIDDFVDKAYREYMNWNVQRMIVLVNSSTDTNWYAKLLSISSSVLLWKGRIKFWKMFDGEAHEKWIGQKELERGGNKKGNSPRFLNTLFYIGDDEGNKRFRHVFKDKGSILTSVSRDKR